MERSKWDRNRRLGLEAYALVNLGFLAPDIYLAHSVNLFRNAAEYIPLVFSVIAPVLLLTGLILGRGRPSGPGWRWLGFFVGWTAVGIGIVGLILHLQSRFFRESTLESLVYTAPFAAPLSFTGIGLLLIMNRMVDPESEEWPRWVLFLALGGFVGNFIFSLADHAQNGFYFITEWIPVVSSAFTIGFLSAVFLVNINRAYLQICLAIMLVQVAVGVLGFYYHTTANLEGPSPSRFDNFIYGAPALAPLLFPNLALLAGFGLLALHQRLGLQLGQSGGPAQRAAKSA